MSEPEELTSPCTSVCQLDGELCIGCGRTVTEIARWVFMSDDEKRAAVSASRERVRALPPPPDV